MMKLFIFSCILFIANAQTVVWERRGGLCYQWPLQQKYYTQVPIGDRIRGIVRSWSECKNHCANNPKCHMFWSNLMNGGPGGRFTRTCQIYVLKDGVSMDADVAEELTGERRRLPSYRENHQCVWKYGFQWTKDYVEPPAPTVVTPPVVWQRRGGLCYQWPLQQKYYTQVPIGDRIRGIVRSWSVCKDHCARNPKCHMFWSNLMNGGPGGRFTRTCQIYVLKDGVSMDADFAEEMMGERRRLPSYRENHQCVWKYGFEWTKALYVTPSPTLEPTEAPTTIPTELVSTCDITVKTKHSVSSCDFGTSFGCTGDNMFVDHGCRATFYVNGGEVTCSSHGYQYEECTIPVPSVPWPKSHRCFGNAIVRYASHCGSDEDICTVEIKTQDECQEICAGLDECVGFTYSFADFGFMQLGTCAPQSASCNFVEEGECETDRKACFFTKPGLAETNMQSYEAAVSGDLDELKRTNTALREALESLMGA